MPSSINISESQNLDTLLESAKPFLHEEYEKIDEKLPSLIAILCSAGAGECFHRLETFLDHLRHVYRIIKLWKAPDSVALCALFHSVYSKSYSSIVLFDPETGRDTVRSLIGHEAERLAHLFCVVHRQSLVHKNIMCQFTESELQEFLDASEVSLRNAKENGVFNSDEKWRKKIQSLVPPSGVMGSHYKTGENIPVSRRMIGVFLLMTLADINEQYFGFQDVLYDNSNGRLELTGSRYDTLYPGNGKPGLWMNAASRMGAVYTLLVREEAIFMQENKHDNGLDRDQDIELVIPPVFNKCTKILDASDQIMARELYWTVVCDDGCDNVKKEKGEEMLVNCIDLNPNVGEPHVLLGQFYLSRGRFDEGESEVEKGLSLLLEWGSAWDKRISWEGWVAWCRVLLNKAKEKSMRTAFLWLISKFLHMTVSRSHLLSMTQTDFKKYTTTTHVIIMIYSLCLLETTHSASPKTINDTYMKKEIDSNINFATPDMDPTGDLDTQNVFNNEQTHTYLNYCLKHVVKRLRKLN